MDDRLKSLLLEPPAQHSSSSARPLIQVVRSEGDDAAKDNSGVSFESKSPDEDYGSDDDDDDDGGPPPIFRATSPARPVIAASAEILSAPSGQQTRHDSSIYVSQNHPETPSLAEQLLAEATLAKEKLQRQQLQKEQQRAKKSTFGMKKGFLNSSSSKNGSSKKKVGGDGDQSISKLVPEKNGGDAAVTEHSGDYQVSGRNITF